MFSLKICSILMLMSTTAALKCSFYKNRIMNDGSHEGSVQIDCTKNDAGKDVSVDITTNSLPQYEITAPTNPNTTYVYTILGLNDTNNEPNDIGCLPQGAIGISKEGVLIYNSLDADGEDAITSEFRSFDTCSGHGNPYHYHTLNSECSFSNLYTRTHAFVGVSLDGYTIRGPFNGTHNLTRSDLDICGGIRINGKYSYIVTPDEFPYFLGCFRNTEALSGKAKNAVSRNTCTTTKSIKSSGYLCACAFEETADYSNTNHNTKRSEISAFKETGEEQKSEISNMKEKRKFGNKDASNLLKLLLEELKTEG